MSAQLNEIAPNSEEIERLISAGRDALTDEMVTRLASTAGDAIGLIDQVNRAGLAKAIPVIAEMVNNGDLERVAQLARVYYSAQDALTDEMIGRLSEAIGGGLNLIDQMQRAGLDRAIPVLAQMVNNGDLQRLAQLARVYISAEDALTDEMVGRIAETIGEGMSLLDRLNRGGARRIVAVLESLESSGALERVARTLPQLAERLETVSGLLGCIEEAATQSQKAPRSSGGIGSLWRTMRDPETQDTLNFLLTLGKQLRTSCKRS